MRLRQPKWPWLTSIIRKRINRCIVSLGMAYAFRTPCTLNFGLQPMEVFGSRFKPGSIRRKRPGSWTRTGISMPGSALFPESSPIRWSFLKCCFGRALTLPAMLIMSRNACGPKPREHGLRIPNPPQPRIVLCSKFRITLPLSWNPNRSLPRWPWVSWAPHFFLRGIRDVSGPLADHLENGSPAHRNPGLNNFGARGLNQTRAVGQIGFAQLFKWKESDGVGNCFSSGL
jgi:hypothetical protein